MGVLSGCIVGVLTWVGCGCIEVGCGCIERRGGTKPLISGGAIEWKVSPPGRFTIL